jgi:hypothetical protein
MKDRLYQNKKWLEKKYCEEKLSVVEIAAKCGSSKQPIYKWIYHFDLTREKVLPRRSKSRYSLNERYFEEINTGDKAYWLGFIAADGCVVNKKGRRHLYIELSEKDRCHLEEFKKEIKFEGPIYEMKARGRSRPSCKIQVSSSRMVLDLVKLGITSNKTYTLKAPEIDPKLYYHWIRGIFDGDGSISLRKDGNLSGEFFGTKKVIEFIVENIPGTNAVSKKAKSEGYYHSFGGNGISAKIYNYLYEDNNTCLRRKRDKFLLKVKDNIV